MYTVEIQDLVLDGIALIYQASHIYRHMGYFFAHPGVSYLGFSKFFLVQVNKKISQNDILVMYHQNRGEWVVGPALNEYVPQALPLVAFQQALALEEQINLNLGKLVGVSDPETQAVVCPLLVEQTKIIARYKGLITKLSRVGDDTSSLLFIERELAALLEN